MQDFDVFFKSLGADFFTYVEEQLLSNPLVVNAPTEEMKRHCEIAIISSLILKEYHTWLSEQFS